MQTNFTFSKQVRIAVAAALPMVFCLGLSAQKKVPPPNERAAPAMASECEAVLDNLVVNCGFESGALAPAWTLFGTDTLDIGVSNGGFVHTGTYSAFLGSVGGLGCISQRLSTTAGQVYTLSFWLSNSGRPNNFQVYWGGGEFPVQVSGDMMNMPDFGYTQYSLPGLTGSGGDLVVFCAQNDPSFFFLDDIVVH